MAALPAALQTWRPWLDWFDPEPAALLGDLLLRLNPLLGRNGARAQDGRLDADGIDDLRRRGPYERLLLSEWMLADSLPEEFERRAANNEHLFLAPKLVSRAADRVLVAVFDAGPAQWGASRLVHVALWILLARRAEATRARYLWGFAHLPGELHDAATPALLQKLLRGRTQQLASTSHWQDWHAYFASSGHGDTERWLIASEHWAESTFSHAAAVRRGFDEQLRVDAGTRTARRKTQLPLPPASQAAWILRGEFQTDGSTTGYRTANGKISLRQPPLWDCGGERVAVPLLGQSRVAIFKVQEESQTKRAAPRYMQWSTHTEVLSAVLSGKQFGALIADPYHLHFWSMPGFRAVPRPGPEQFAIMPGLPRWLSSAWLNSGRDLQRFLALDNRGNLCEWLGQGAGKHWRGSGTTQGLVDSDVLAVSQPDALHVLYVRYQSGHLLLNMIARNGRATTIAQQALAERPASVMLCGEIKSGSWRGAICVERGSGQRGGDRSVVCKLFHGRPQDGLREAEIILAPHSRLLGLARDTHESNQFLLLALSPNRRVLLGVGTRGSETLYRSSVELSTGSVSANGERVALVDLDGKLLVLTEGGRRLIMGVRGEPDSNDA
jgi:hypothetical protein